MADKIKEVLDLNELRLEENIVTQ